MPDNALWDDMNTEVFIHAMLTQVYAHERRGLSFSKAGWKGIVEEFNQKTGRGYDRKQLKNRFDILRKDLRTWERLVSETGLGRDPEARTLDATDDWWQKKCREDRAYLKFRRGPLRFEKELKIIFRDIYATGEGSYCPSPSQPLSPEAEDDDVYIPAMDEQEGSGDSQDESFGAQPAPSTGVTDELLAARLSSQSGPSEATDSGGRGKRKRVAPARQRKKSRVPPAERLVDAVSVMANVTAQRSAIVTDIVQRSSETVVRDLITLDAVKADPQFRIRCIQMLSQDKGARDTFVGLWKDNHEYLVEWLRFAVDCYFGD